MTIVRIDPADRWSDAVIHNQTIYYTGVPENLDGDAGANRHPVNGAGQRQIPHS